MTLSQDNLERTFAWLEEALARDSGLTQEFEASLVTYFSHRSRGIGALDPLAHRRHLEWFLMERYSPGRGGVPIEVLVHESRSDALEADAGEGTREQALASMLSSLASVFEVTGVLQGEGAWVRDLAGGGEYALEEPEASHALQAGDLLVGRLFDVGDTLHRMSSAAGVFRESRLREALTRDLKRARASRRGSLRLSQAELERMFWGDPVGSDGEQAVARARTLLQSGGVPDELIESVLNELLASPYDSASILPGAHDALGHALERLAFETTIDLDLARQALLDAWSSSAPVAAGEQAATAAVGDERTAGGEVDVEAAMSAFDQGRREGRDLEQLFRELERDLGLDGDTEEEPAEEAPVPDFPGAVGAVVEEYLWDLERQGDIEGARRDACLRKLGDYGQSIGVFENLAARDLLVFGAIWLPELGELGGAEDARTMLAALENFCRWCDDQQEVPLSKEFEQGAAALVTSLPRVIEANRLRERGAEITQGEVFEILDVSQDRMTLQDGRGAAREAQAHPDLTAHLRAGDRLRAEVGADGRLHLYCCYPPESARIAPK